MEIPQFFVVDLDAYTLGISHGIWCVATDNVTAIQHQIDQLLWDSPKSTIIASRCKTCTHIVRLEHIHQCKNCQTTDIEHGHSAKSFAIHSFIDMPSSRANESISTLCKIGRAIIKYGLSEVSSFMRVYDGWDEKTFKHLYIASAPTL